MKGAVVAVILAGGEGSRIGGNKPLRHVGGQRLIDRALVLARCWTPHVVVAARLETQVAPVNAEVIGDEPGIDGPLAGLIAGLRFAGRSGAELLLSLPADMPFLPADLRDRLVMSIGAEPCAVACSGGQLQPVCALWRTDALPGALAYARSGRRSLKGLASALGFATAEWPADPDPFFNVNNATDLAEAERRLGV